MFVCILVKMKWPQFDLSIVDADISQWRRRLIACVRVQATRGTLRAYILTILNRTVFC